MPKKRSAGLLLYRIGGDKIFVMLVHPGGPFWAKKDLGAWSIPKGEFEAGENALQAAIRELREETGAEAAGNFIALGDVAQSNKIVSAWAVAGDFDPASLRSTLCEIEWPPRSGKKRLIPEVDEARWFDLEEARTKIVPAQRPFLERLRVGRALTSDGI